LIDAFERAKVACVLSAMNPAVLAGERPPIAHPAACPMSDVKKTQGGTHRRRPLAILRN
jgi:hypothetical protein